MKHGGFTLVELLIALVLTSLLAVLVSGGLRIATQTWHSLYGRSDALQEALLAEQFLRELLAGSNDMRLRSDDSRTLQVVMYGDQQQLIFLAPQPRQLGPLGTPTWCQLALVDTEDGPALTLTLLPMDTEENRISWPDLEERLRQEGRQLVLTRAVQGLQFDYYRVRDRQGDWRPQWQGENQLPELIRIQFQVAEENRLFWPALSIQPQGKAYGLKSPS